MVKRFIFVPVVNNLNLLKKAVNGIKSELYDDYIIFNNTEAQIPDEIYSNTPFRVLTPPKRMTFRQTQNMMLKHAIENNYDYYSFMHNDCEVIDDADVRLVNMADNLVKNGEDDWGLIFSNYDVLCVFKTSSLKKIGDWGDENWPPQESGYYLDNDYYRRLVLSGFKLLQLERAEGVLHNEPSNTIRNEKEHAVWDKQQKSVQCHYVNKWGSLPPNEKFTVPFDR